jgi:hypothetical protein
MGAGIGHAQGYHDRTKTPDGSESTKARTTRPMMAATASPPKRMRMDAQVQVSWVVFGPCGSTQSSPYDFQGARDLPATMTSARPRQHSQPRPRSDFAPDMAGSRLACRTRPLVDRRGGHEPPSPSCWERRGAPAPRQAFAAKRRGPSSELAFQLFRRPGSGTPESASFPCLRWSKAPRPPAAW